MDDELIERSKQMMLDVTDTTLREGVSRKTGGVYNIGRSGAPLDKVFHWWVQAEAIVGFLYVSTYQGSRIFFGLPNRFGILFKIYCGF